MNWPLKAYALVTGASSGIGRAIALELAAGGADLLLLSNDEEGLKTLKASISRDFGVKVEILCMDLARANAAKKVLSFCQEHEITVDMLVNNVGVFSFGALACTPPERVEAMIALHISCSTALIQAFAPSLMERRRGYILNISSMSVWMPMPGIGVYNATKSYIRNLSLSLYYELKPYKVGVTVVCPGGIDTNLFNLPVKIRQLGVKLGFLMKPEKLAKKALRVCFKRRKHSVPGFLNHFLLFFMRCIPDCFIFLIMRKLKIYQNFRPPHA
ncbi:MAG: SDR family NAD(P)-dependent oxidoreductase [Bradymonadales bacterium]